MAKPDPELLDPASYRFHVDLSVRFGDLDRTGRVSETALAAAFESARVEYFRVLTDGQGKDVYSVMAALEISYFARGSRDAPLRSHIGVLSTGRTSWVMAQLVSQAGKPITFAHAISACSAEGRPVPIPDRWRGILEANMILK